MSEFDPWAVGPASGVSGGKKKIARLAGKRADSRKVHVLIKLHDWAGRAIYIYNLLTGQIRHISQPSEEVWNQYREIGVEISHPGGIQATDVSRWVSHGKREAERLGLQVAE